MPAFDISAYLDRIGQSTIPLTLEGLGTLQAAQLRSIPFENIDPLIGRTPDLEPHAIFRKTVLHRRGGYCFELNTLLEDALVSLGFRVRRSLARVRMGASSGGPRSHLTLQIDLEGRRYLADAGFGGPTLLSPLDIDTAEEQIAPNGTFRITDDPASGEKVVERQKDAGWFALYGFDDAHVGDMDIKAANFLCANWKEFPFTDHLMVNGYDGNERIGIFDRTVTTETPAETRRREFADFLDFTGTLVGTLRLPIDHETLQYLWDRIRVGRSDETIDGVA